MKEWEIKVLYFGKIEASLSLVWPPMSPPLEEDFSMAAPYLGFLLKSRDRVILVDTGINEKFIVDGKAWGMLPAEGGAPFVEAALKENGLSREDIETVILTHLHNDHAGNCGLFPKARFIFQKDEWHNLLSPYPHQKIRNDYDEGIIEELRNFKISFADGILDVDEGVRLYKMPGGHSQGSQVVCVNTAKGNVVLLGDIALFNFLAFPQSTEVTDMHGAKHAIPQGSSIYGPAIPHTVIYDSFGFYDAMSQIRAMVPKDEPGYLIPGHEPSLLVNGV